MKTPVSACLALVAIGFLSSTHVRTWTSSDGERTFEGELREYSPEKGEVTVILSNGASSTFPETLLSEADREWLKNRPCEPGKPVDASGNAQAEEAPKSLMASMISGNTHRLDEGVFVATESQKKNAEVYVLMFSASWCGPCVSSAPKAVREYKAGVLRNPKVEWVHISMDRSADDALKWAKKEKMSWLTVLPGSGGRHALRKFLPGGIPHYALVNSEGEKLATGLDDIMRVIKKSYK